MKQKKHWSGRVRWGRLLVLLGIVIGIGYSWPTYQPPARTEVRLRLNYLERVIGEGAAPLTTLGKLTALNPEWGLFTLSFSTYALANLAAQQPALGPEATRTMRQAVAVALTAPMQQPYHGLGDSQLAGYVLPGSVLYLGHLNLMLGCLRQLEPGMPYRTLHDSLSARLYRQLQAAPAGNLASYPGRYWVPDNAVALASLALHSSLTGSPYQRAGAHWVAQARRQWLDPATGLLVSMVDAAGQPTEAPRGSHLGWSIWFLARFDSAFARQQYQRYQVAHSTNLGVLRLYREQPGRYATGEGDVDSGPLILGYGIPATAFACADAVALRDWRNAQRLRRVIALGSREIVENNELSYGVRLVDLNVNPLSEALLLWAEVPGGG